jgi:hypothetical protein
MAGSFFIDNGGSLTLTWSGKIISLFSFWTFNLREMAITQKPLRPRRHLVWGQLPIMPNLRSPSFGFEIFSVFEIRLRRDSWCFVQLQYDCLCPLVGFSGTAEKWPKFDYFIKRKPNVRQSSFDDFPVGKPHCPTPTANFRNVLGRLVHLQYGLSH